MTQYTPNYNLDLYEGSDKPDLTDQYDNAMGKIDQVLKTSAGNLAELSNKVGTLNESLNTANGLIDEINAELTALGITDVETAAALLTKIDGYQTAIDDMNSQVAANTADIQNVDGMVAEIKGDYVVSDFTGGPIPSSAASPLPKTFAFNVWVNENNTCMKVFGTLQFVEGTYNLEAIPGQSGVYGVKVALTTPFPTRWRNRVYNNACTTFYLTPDGTTKNMGSSSFRIGDDGNLYLCPYSTSTLTVGSSSTLYFQYFQIPYYAANMTSNA